MGVPHPIPYQGSKRWIARAIVASFPPDAQRLFEPFAGSAAVSLAAAYLGKAKCFFLNDTNVPLMDLWNKIINEPEVIAAQYRKLWESQQGKEREYYDTVRAKFNKTPWPGYLLYLLARCVKASVRYNAKGEFNQSPDNRRKGAHPDTMEHHTLAASHLLKGHTTLSSCDYRKALKNADPSDVVYMDPPYQGVCGNRDPRYVGGLLFDDFVETLRWLNDKGIAYIVSYDGRTGSKRFGRRLPSFLGLKHLEIAAGRSSQATLLGRNRVTYESLYLSPMLVSRTNGTPPGLVRRPTQQLPLFGISV
jgi:DNA adenine methylase